MRMLMEDPGMPAKESSQSSLTAFHHARLVASAHAVVRPLPARSLLNYKFERVERLPNASSTYTGQIFCPKQAAS